MIYRVVAHFTFNSEESGAQAVMAKGLREFAAHVEATGVGPGGSMINERGDGIEWRAIPLDAKAA